MTAVTDETPMVSVVMPVYNASAYLREAIESILSQTLTSLELIIVDDNSTDDSAAVVEPYLNADRRVRLLRHQQNLGNYPARNAGMAIAQGQFVAVMDADDISLPRRLEQQVDFLRRHPDHVMIGSRVLLVDSERDPIAPGTAVNSPIGPLADLPTTHDAIDAALMNCRWAVVHPTVMMRRSAVEASGGYCETYRTCADHDLYLRLAEIGRIANLPQTLLHYRQHYRSLTRVQGDQMHNLRIIQRIARERRGLPPLVDVSIPPMGTLEPLTARQRMELHCAWAAMAMRHGYTRSAIKHLRISFTIDPAGALSWSLRRAGKRLNSLVRT